jgi:hypothetical protein
MPQGLDYGRRTTRLTEQQASGLRSEESCQPLWKAEQSLWPKLKPLSQWSARNLVVRRIDSAE